MPYSKIDDIERHIKEIQSLMEWAPVAIGSPLRVHSYSYRKWGIVITPENLEWIEHIQASSKKSFETEWAPTDSSMNTLIADVCIASGITDANEGMNVKGAEYGREYLAPRLVKPGLVKVIDIGAGAGATTLAMLRAIKDLKVHLFAGLSIVLIEPSQKRLETAFDAIYKTIAGTSIEHAVHPMAKQGLVDVLHDLESDSADLVISNAALHHESFYDHFPQIVRVLKPGTEFISGDWHESTYESPRRTYWIYYLLQDPNDGKALEDAVSFVLGNSPISIAKERQELKDFRKLFDLSEANVCHAFDNLTESERRASVGSIRYWVEMGKRFSEKNKSPEVLLQGHERVAKRIENLKNAGFVFDSECRSKYHELLKDKGYGELASVMIAKKRLR